MFLSLLLAVAIVIAQPAALAAPTLEPAAWQEPAPETPAQEGQERPDGPGRPQPPAEPRPYDKVITKEAETRHGVFTVHKVKQKWFYEIPRAELNREFLWSTQVAQASEGVARGGGLHGVVVRWERHDNRILLRHVRYGMVADPSRSLARGVAASNASPILASFPVQAWGKDEAAVIDVSSFLVSDVRELNPRAPQRVRVDAARSYVERISTFPENVEAVVVKTYPPAQTGPGAPAPAPAPGGAGPADTTTITFQYSMVKLPEKPMMPRLYDSRVGYFSIQQLDFGRDDHEAAQRRYITRWRLEKKDPAAALSEPVKPIVYYVDPATPKWLVPYVKRGVEQWQAAFEEAGFKNAIIAKEAPSPEEDPEWSTEDVRYTIVRWLPSTTENAMGPSVRDPRSGEILNGNISMYHNILRLQRGWYFTQAAPLDPRAHKLPLPNDLMGELVEYVVAHEVGHTLGLQHNMMASSTYPAEKVRDREWVKRMGHVPSVMDYSRFNYVAQPEDNIDVRDLQPRVGPYDKWVIAWGYKPIPQAGTPDDEKPTLHAWALQQDETPWFRFGPGRTEAVGDADPVASTRLGLKNLQRVSDLMLSATSTVPGDSYELLDDMYRRLVGQWQREIGHVAAMVGEVQERRRHVGQEGPVYIPRSREEQRAAVAFLGEHAFQVHPLFLNPDVLSRIEPVGALARVAGAQRSVLGNVLSPAVLTRLLEQKAMGFADAYAPQELLADVRAAVWRELEARRGITVGTFRRQLQRAYVDHIGLSLVRATFPAPSTPAPPRPGFRPPPPPSDEVRALFRGELLALSGMVNTALSRAGDQATRAHLEDLRAQIANALDPKVLPPSASAPGRPAFADLGLGFEPGQPQSCWPDDLQD